MPKWLRRAAQAFFDGDYEAVPAAMESKKARSREAAFFARLFLGASLHGRFLTGEEPDRDLLRSAVESAKFEFQTAAAQPFGDPFFQKDGLNAGFFEGVVKPFKLDDIKVYSSDTDVTPFDTGAYASSTTYISGTAAKLAAEAVEGDGHGVGTATAHDGVGQGSRFGRNTLHQVARCH